MSLVDELGSSDDYLMRLADDKQIYAVTYKGHEGMIQKLQAAFASVAASIGFGARLP